MPEIEKWLNEIEGFSTHIERLTEDVEHNNLPAVKAWLAAAYSLGRQSVGGGNIRGMEMTVTDQMVEAFETQFKNHIDRKTAVKSGLKAVLVFASKIKEKSLLENFVSDMNELIEFLAENPDNIYHLDAVEVSKLRSALAVQAKQESTSREFQIGDLVRKKSGSWWEGRVVGHYSTEQTLDGVCVQLDKPSGPVQIYPSSAMELCKGGDAN